MRRVCIVTGASRGIGRGIALVLARDEGNVVYATARSEASLQALAAEVAASGAGGGVLVPVAVDHTDDDSARGLVERVLRERGVVDLLVNNAYGGVSVLAENFGSM
jgi:dehydrogenase/reductase SDR family protein 1